MPGIPLFTVALLFLLQAGLARKPVYFFLAGLATGLAALSRPNLFLIVPIALFWFLFNRIHWRRLAWLVIIYLVTIFLVTLPAAWHNYQTAGRFVPTPTSGWEILFLGNNPVAEGMGTIDYVLYNHFDIPGEQYARSILKAGKHNYSVYQNEIKRFILTDFGGWLNLLGRKTYLLLWETDDRLISPYFLHNLQTVPLLHYLPLRWRSIFVGAILGIFLLRYKPRNLLLLLTLAALILLTIPFHIQFRFRLLFVPLVLLYVSGLIVNAPRLSRSGFVLALVVLAGLVPFLPELGWLLLLFTASTLWPYRQRRNWQLLRWSALAAWSYLVVALLLSQVITFMTQTGQPQAIFSGLPVAGSVALGQSFIVKCDGFNRVSLVLGTFGPVHSQPVTLHLQAGMASVEDIHRVTFEVTEVTDRMGRDFTFPTQADSAGQAYFLYLEAPLAAPAESITLRGAYDQPFDRYGEGSAYAGQPGAWQKLPADLAFTAWCDTGLLQLTNQTFQRLAGQVFGSAIFYWTILLTHLATLVAALLRLLKLTNWLKPLT